jgi:hypothetical protein
MYHYIPGLYLVCTWYVLGTYRYVLVRTWKNQNLNAQNVQIRTVNLVHSILRAIPLRYQHAFHGNVYGQYMVYSP